jgi:hypothetical protein
MGDRAGTTASGGRVGEWRFHRWIGLIAGLAGVLAIQSGLAGCDFVSFDLQQEGQTAAAADQEEQGLEIENDSQLPDTYPHASYQVRLQAHGGVSGVHHWRIVNGTLPAGIRLEEDGFIHGAALRAGEFRFTVAVSDVGSQPGAQKSFVIRVRSELTLNWKSPAHVSGNRIEGSAEVINATSDAVDLTFIVLAVASNGRATAIGYQHFVLNPGLNPTTLPFGDTLPPGGYVVHVDAVGEVAARNRIYRQRLQTDGPLQVTVGP